MVVSIPDIQHMIVSPTEESERHENPDDAITIVSL